MKKIIVLTIVLSSLLLISCSEDFFDKPIDLDIDEHTSKLAGTAFLGADSSTDQLLVSYSIGPFDRPDSSNLNSNQIIENATVTLTGNGETHDFNYDDLSKFYNTTVPIDFMENKTYTLTIEAPNYETITATQTYPKIVEILEASINENTFKIKFNDNGSTENFYALKLLRGDGQGGFYDSYLEPFGSLTKASGFCYNCVIFNDDTFNGDSNVEIVVNHYNSSTLGNYKAVLYHITEDFYRYDVTLKASRNAEDNPFVEPVILQRNFENGYGIFGLTNVSELGFN